MSQSKNSKKGSAAPSKPTVEKEDLVGPKNNDTIDVTPPPEGAKPPASGPFKQRWIARAKTDHRTTIVLSDGRKVEIVYHNHTLVVDEHMARVHKTTPAELALAVMNSHEYGKDVLFTEGPKIDPENPLVKKWNSAALKAIDKKTRRIRTGVRSTDREQ